MQRRKVGVLKMVAAVLAAMMLVQSPVTTFASVSDSVLPVENTVSDEAVSDNNVPADVTIDEEKPVEEQISDNVLLPEETVSENEIEEVQETVVSENSVSANEVEGMEKYTEYGFSEMKLSEEMRADKEEVSIRKNESETLVEGKDYHGGQVVFWAENQTEAEQIAKAYNAKLKKFAYNVGVLDTGDVDPKIMVEAGADINNSMPAVYFDTINSIETAEVSNVEIVNGIQVPDKEPLTEGAIEDPRFPTIDPNGAGAAAAIPSYNALQWFHDFIGSKTAWEYADGTGVTVAVVDSGVFVTHPDLEANCQLEGYNAFDGSSDVSDGNGHGTHVAGIIAASGEANSVYGVAYKASILPVKVLATDGYSAEASVAIGINWATANGADIINMSLGGPCWSLVDQKAVAKAISKGVVVVCAAGNDASDHQHWPAAYPNVISVAAINSENQDGLASFSNAGSWVSIAAPGHEIYSTTNPGSYNTPDNNLYESWPGTSMACPVVAGTVALMMSADPSLNGKSVTTVKKLSKMLLANVKDNTYMGGGGSVYGGLNAAAAVGDAALKTVDTPVITPSTPLDAKGTKIQSGPETSISIECTTPHAQIYYTTNGKTPSKTTGIPYTGAIGLLAKGKLTVKAVAYVGALKSKVVTKTYTLVAPLTDFGFEGGTSYRVAVGKTIQLKPIFTPAYASNQKVTYTSDNTSQFTVNKTTGVVTCKKGTPVDATATITAVSAEGEISRSVTVTAIEAAATKLELNSYSGTLNWLENETHQITAIATGGAEQFIYTSSNPKVATVSKTGLVTALSKGSANITVMVNDGSKKKAVYKVKTYTPVVEINALKSSTGFYDDDTMVDFMRPLAKGCSVKLTAYLNADYRWYDKKEYDKRYIPTNSKITWSSSNPEAISVSKTGVIKCDPKATTGTDVIITATAVDDSYKASKSITFTVTPKATKMTVSPSKYVTRVGFSPGIGTTLDDIFDTVNVYSNGTGEQFSVYREIKHNSAFDFFNTKTQENLLVGTKPGTGTIIYSLRDGSGKQVKVTVTVKQ